MHGYVDPHTEEAAPLISDTLKDLISEHGERLNAAIVYDRDFDYDFFGFKTLERSYLLKMNGEVVRAVEEAPPHPLPNAAALLAPRVAPTQKAAAAARKLAVASRVLRPRARISAPFASSGVL